MKRDGGKEENLYLILLKDKEMEEGRRMPSTVFVDQEGFTGFRPHTTFPHITHIKSILVVIFILITSSSLTLVKS